MFSGNARLFEFDTGNRICWKRGPGSEFLTIKGLGVRGPTQTQESSRDRQGAKTEEWRRGGCHISEMLDGCCLLALVIDRGRE